MSLLRIRRQEADGKGVRRAGAGAAEGADSYIERLLKLIPAEAIGIYLVGLQIVGVEAENHVAISKWTLACLVFVFVFRAIASAESPRLGLATGKGLRQWWKDFKAEVQWGAVLIATFSFFVWASALGYPVAPNLSASLNACSVPDMASNVICVGQKTGTLILLLWTPLAAFLYAGHRIGNLAPPDDDDD